MYLVRGNWKCAHGDGAREGERERRKEGGTEGE